MGFRFGFWGRLGDGVGIVLAEKVVKDGFGKKVWVAPVETATSSSFPFHALNVITWEARREFFSGPAIESVFYILLHTIL